MIQIEVPKRRNRVKSDAVYSVKTDGHWREQYCYKCISFDDKGTCLEDDQTWLFLGNLNNFGKNWKYLGHIVDENSLRVVENWEYVCFN